jgi:excinuclease Cho
MTAPAVHTTTAHTAIAPQCLDALPRSAGVYIFRGEGTLPLYIGKSVDIRARVLSHLRAPDEAKMVAQTRWIDFIETAGEIGALLLEAQMVKVHSPLFNIRLRRLRHLCAIRLRAADTGLTPEIVSSRDTAVGQVDGLYGLFSSRHAVQARLRELAKEHALCHALLGLEKPSPRGCFGLQIKTCHGACVGREDRSAHDQRLWQALQDMKVHVWPYAGAIDLVETQGDWVQKHRIQNWRYLGTWCSRAQAVQGQAEASFDLDTYKILVKPLLLQSVNVEVL